MSLSHFTDEEIETQIVDDKAEFQTQSYPTFFLFLLNATSLEPVKTSFTGDKDWFGKDEG